MDIVPSERAARNNDAWRTNFVLGYDRVARTATYNDDYRKYSLQGAGRQDVSKVIPAELFPKPTPDTTNPARTSTTRETYADFLGPSRQGVYRVNRALAEESKLYHISHKRTFGYSPCTHVSEPTVSTYVTDYFPPDEMHSGRVDTQNAGNNMAAPLPGNAGRESVGPQRPLSMAMTTYQWPSADRLRHVPKFGQWKK